MPPEDLTPTQRVIHALEDSLKKVRSDFEQTIEEWRNSDAEKRASIDDKLVALEERIDTLSQSIEDKHRTTLPGSEPSKTDPRERFSFTRAIMGHKTNNWEGREFERDVLKATQHAMSSGSDAAGGFLVPDEAIPQVIERLKAETVTLAMGARQLPASGSPIQIPRLKTSATATWMGSENSTITASDLAFEDITLSPKTVAARVILSNQLIELSSPAADSIVEADLVSQLSIGMDAGFLEGTGASGQPLGIVNEPNTNGGTFTDNQVTWSELLAAPEALAVDNALRGRLGWVITPQILTELRTIVNPTNVDIARRVLSDGPDSMILGYPYMTTTGLTGASGTGAGAAIFGNWDDLLVAMWGGIRVRASDSSDDAFSKDQTHIRAIVRVDSAVRHPESFFVST